MGPIEAKKKACTKNVCSGPNVFKAPNVFQAFRAAYRPARQTCKTSEKLAPSLQSLSVGHCMVDIWGWGSGARDGDRGTRVGGGWVGGQNFCGDYQHM